MSHEKMVPEEIYKIKIAALLHDPPHKPYLIVSEISHERKAVEMMKKIFESNEAMYLSDPRVKLADYIASGIDRWILMAVMGHKYIPGLFPVRKIKLKNIVAPYLEKHINKNIDSNKIEHYVEELHDLLAKLKDWRSKYLLFYLLYEVLWILNDLPIGPADTRVPTHTVFDHNYATATMTNWVYDKNKIDGLLVGLDIAGVQSFISESRKIRDMWVSSYVISALMWYTLCELIEIFGPDIVIIPSMRLNPFYLHWLLQKFGNEISDYQKEIKKIVYMFNHLREMYDDLGIPPYPMIPGMATLALPPWDIIEKFVSSARQKTVEEYFIERFEKGWRILWKLVKKYAEQSEDPIWSIFVRKALDYFEREFKDAGFDRISPLELRVEYVRVSKDITEQVKLMLPWEIYDEKYRELSSKLAYKKYKRINKIAKLKLHELSKKAFTDTGYGYPKQSNRGFDYCTMCGKAPALIIMPRENELEKILLEELEPVENMDEALRMIEQIKSVFSPGEKLCPWCFLKRLLSLEPMLLNALLIGIKEDDEEIQEFVSNLLRMSRPKIWFPSTSHIASIRLYEKLLEYGAPIISDICEQSKQSIKNLQKYIPLGAKLKKAPRDIWTWYFTKKIRDKLLKEGARLKQTNFNCELILYTIYYIDPEEMWFHSQFPLSRRRAWEKLLRIYGLHEWLYRYYTLIRADGDSIGGLLEGLLTAFLCGRLSNEFYLNIYFGESYKIPPNEEKSAIMFLKEYIMHLCEGDLRTIIKKYCELINNEISEDSFKKSVNPLLEKAQILYHDLRKNLDQLIGSLLKVRGGNPLFLLRIPITPTYHATISAALLRGSLFDIALITYYDGFVVYSGGDDLIAFVPVDSSLDVIYNTRRAFSGFKIGSVNLLKSNSIEIGDGFIRIREAYLPMLPNVGRSYIMYIAHYKYPLTTVVNNAFLLLKKVKKNFLLKYVETVTKMYIIHQQATKDTLLVAYNPRGREEFTIIPLSWHRPIVSILNITSHHIADTLLLAKNLLRYSDKRISHEDVAISRSFFYDIHSDINEPLLKELLKKACESSSEDEFSRILTTARSLIRTLIKRNLTTKYRDKLDEIFNDTLKPLLDKSCNYIGVGYGMFKEDTKSEKFIEIPVLFGIIDSVRFIRSGMR